jgi:hypothetical protein
MKDNAPRSIAAFLPRALFVSTFLLASALSACGDGETSTCEVGGACEAQQMNQCSCCPSDQIYTCQANISDACSTGQLEVSGTAESCQEFNASWQTISDLGEDPCQEFSSDEVSDFCDGAQALFE